MYVFYHPASETTFRDISPRFASRCEIHVSPLRFVSFGLGAKCFGLGWIAGSHQAGVSVEDPKGDLKTQVPVRCRCLDSKVNFGIDHIYMGSNRILCVLYIFTIYKFMFIEKIA